MSTNEVKEEQKIEGRLPLRFDVAASLKIQFEEACRVNGKNMTEVITGLMADYIAR